MDKDDAIRLSSRYLRKLKRNDIPVLKAWMFGSYAKGNFNEDSDIDLAIVLPDEQLSFDMDVRLMTLRTGEETMIETHAYSPNDFNGESPVISQIKKFGIPVTV
jgi:predicted nucleotidyltransferase